MTRSSPGARQSAAESARPGAPRRGMRWRTAAPNRIAPAVETPMRSVGSMGGAYGGRGQGGAVLSTRPDRQGVGVASPRLFPHQSGPSLSCYEPDARARVFRPHRGRGVEPRVEQSPATAGRSGTRGRRIRFSILPRRGRGTSFDFARFALANVQRRRGIVRIDVVRRVLVQLVAPGEEHIPEPFFARAEVFPGERRVLELLALGP